MVRWPALQLSLIAISFLSVVLALSGQGEAGVGYWYLFFSPLVLAACFYGLKGALATGIATWGSLALLYRNAF